MILTQHKQKIGKFNKRVEIIKTIKAGTASTSQNSKMMPKRLFGASSETITASKQAKSRIVLTFHHLRSTAGLNKINARQKDTHTKSWPKKPKILKTPQTEEFVHSCTALNFQSPSPQTMKIT